MKKYFCGHWSLSTLSCCSLYLSLLVFRQGLNFLLNYSASHCDVDENGVRHMLFCRVIMGNMEAVCPGTRQYRPSCKDYDSGVDDLENPRFYIIWTMNMNTHIYPEFVVRFKISTKAEGEISLLLCAVLFHDSHFSMKLHKNLCSHII